MKISRDSMLSPANGHSDSSDHTSLKASHQQFAALGISPPTILYRLTSTPIAISTNSVTSKVTVKPYSSHKPCGCAPRCTAVDLQGSRCARTNTKRHNCVLRTEKTQMVFDNHLGKIMGKTIEKDSFCFLNRHRHNVGNKDKNAKVSGSSIKKITTIVTTLTIKTRVRTPVGKQIASSGVHKKGKG